MFKGNKISKFTIDELKEHVISKLNDSVLSNEYNSITHKCKYCLSSSRFLCWPPLRMTKMLCPDCNSDSDDDDDDTHDSSMYI